MSAAPVIETERLILRGHTKADLDACAALWGDEEVTRYIGGRPFARDEVWARLLRYVGHWQEMGYGFWAITEKDSSRFIGELGFADFKRALEPSFGDTPEMGWVLSPAGGHGKGYASEAAAAALAWADARFDQGRTVCMIHPDNGPSLRVAEKAGFREFARTDYHGPSILLERFRK
ncbi:MAG: acetyltransferase [Phenylobacterium sp.]|nr:acetyltransferase [Phenylobacterium sp.]